MRGWGWTLVALTLSAAGAVLSAARAPRSPLRPVAVIRLQRAGRGFNDYLIVDPQKHRLYAGYASSNTLVAIDTQTNRIVGRVVDLQDVRSVAIVPALGLGFTSDRGEDKIGVVRLADLTLLKRIPVGRGPDAIIYDPAAVLVYCGEHEAHAGVLVDPNTQAVTATIPLGGSAEYIAADPHTGLIYQNLEDVSQVAVIDPQERRVVRRFGLGEGREPSGLALDPERHRLFVACGNKRLVVLNEEDGRVVAVLPIGGDVDFAAYDPGLRRVYVPSGDGKLTVIQQQDADHYRILANVPTRRSTPRLAVDPATHRIYVVAGAGDHAEVLVYEAIQ
jgi:DNA-binding beta-propeller fold protein YncE